MFFVYTSTALPVAPGKRRRRKRRRSANWDKK
jgi:hypothetical protein